MAAARRALDGSRGGAVPSLGSVQPCAMFLFHAVARSTRSGEETAGGRAIGEGGGMGVNSAGEGFQCVGEG